MNSITLTRQAFLLWALKICIWKSALKWYNEKNRILSFTFSISFFYFFCWSWSTLIWSVTSCLACWISSECFIETLFSYAAYLSYILNIDLGISKKYIYKTIISLFLTILNVRVPSYASFEHSIDQNLITSHVQSKTEYSFLLVFFPWVLPNLLSNMFIFWLL